MQGSRAFRLISILYAGVFLYSMFYAVNLLPFVPLVYFSLQYFRPLVLNKNIFVVPELKAYHIAGISWIVVELLITPSLSVAGEINRLHWIMMALHMIPMLLFLLAIFKHSVKYFLKYNAWHFLMDLVLCSVILALSVYPAFKNLLHMYPQFPKLRFLLYSIGTIACVLLSVIVLYFTKVRRLFEKNYDYNNLFFAIGMYVFGIYLSSIRLVFYPNSIPFEQIAFTLYTVFFFAALYSTTFVSSKPKYKGVAFAKSSVFYDFRLSILLVAFVVFGTAIGVIERNIAYIMLILIFINLNIDLIYKSKRVTLEIIEREHSSNQELEKLALRQSESLTEANKKLMNRILIDSLTGLNSLEFFYRKVEDLKKLNCPEFSLMAINIDDFKNVNNIYGHDVGDKLLVEISGRLKSEFGHEAYLIKLESDEFGVCFIDSSFASIEDYYNRISDALNSDYLIDGHKFMISFSLSIARYPADASNAEELIQRADIAMVEAKKMRTERKVMYFSSNFVRNIKEKNRFERHMSTLSMDREFSISYQTQHRFSNNEVACVSSMLIWNNKDFFEMDLSDILLYFEQAGKIQKLFAWFFNNVGVDISEHLNSGRSFDKYVITISSKSLEIVQSLPHMVSAFKSRGIPLNKIELSVHSDLLFAVFNSYPAVFKSIENYGMSVSIKDFGIGYSSLSHIKKCSVKKIVISQSLIENLDTDKQDYLVVKSIVMIGKGLGIEIMADGVERISQYWMLERSGCNLVSGPFISSPMCGEEFWNSVAVETVL